MARLALAIIVIVAYAILTLFFHEEEVVMPEGHFSAVVALPMAAALTLILVTLMPSYGATELEVLGIKLKGWWAQSLLWPICFLAIVAAIRLVWPLYWRSLPPN